MDGPLLETGKRHLTCELSNQYARRVFDLLTKSNNKPIVLDEKSDFRSVLSAKRT